MVDLISNVLFLVPIVLACVAGIWFSRQEANWKTMVGLALVTTYPVLHWYILRTLRQIFLDLDFKSEAVASSITGLLMMAELPICLIVYVAGRIARWRRARRIAGS